MNLPIDFYHKMKDQLGDEFEAFLASYDKPYYKGLRVNTRKISVEDFVASFPFELSEIPWIKEGFYYEDDAVTKHPYYHAGLFYIQEPSAMAVANELDIESDQLVLDLCAAPGGKTTQIATRLGDGGLLVTNDISDKRVKAIIRNVEKYGITQVIVLNERQDNLVEAWGPIFDRVLVDAPCSGEGMFRKDPKAMKAYETYDNNSCVIMQKEILEVITEVLKPGGQMVYSTCTFSKDENEHQVKAFLANKPEMLPRVIQSDYYRTQENTARLWPHLLEGEGHFIAAFRKWQTDEHQLKGEIENFDEGRCTAAKNRVVIRPEPNEAPKVLAEFMANNMIEPLKGHFNVIKDKVYLLPPVTLELKGLKVAREGWLLGELKKNRFVPSQALALGVKPSKFKRVIDFQSDSESVRRYLKCESLFVEGYENGFYLVTTDSYPLGFCKIQEGQVKNLYPASWRLV